MRIQLKLGFTLIEVLVTLVILMFGLLGIAGLMAKGQRVSFEAFQRHQALQIANEMAERVRANKQQAAAYAAAAAVGAPVGAGSQFSDLKTGVLAPNCATSACTAAQLVAYDIALWDGMLQGYGEVNAVGGARTGGVINARGCIEVPALAPANTYRISVAWQGNDDTAVNAADRPSACGAGLYGTEGLRRLVSLDVMAF